MTWQQTRSRLTLVLTLLFFGIGCDSGTEAEEIPPVGINGSWNLVSVNGVGIPGAVQDPLNPNDPNAAFEFGTGTLLFKTDDSWSFSVTIDSSPHLFTGDFEVSGDDVSMTWTGFGGSSTYEDMIADGVTLRLSGWTEAGVTMVLTYANTGRSWRFQFVR